MNRRKELYNAVINDVENIEQSIVNRDSKHFKYFVELDRSTQYIVFKIMLDALKIIMFESFKLQISITLPYIGKMKVKIINKLVIKLKQDVATELGYISYDRIYKEDLDKAKTLLKLKIDKDIKDYLKSEKENRVLKNTNKINKLSTGNKVLKFNIKNIIK